MINHKKLSIYLPEELYQTLFTYQKQQKFETASDSVVEILSQFFHQDNEVKRYATVEQLKELENQVTHLNKQIAQIYQNLVSLTPTEASKKIPAESIDYMLESSGIEDMEEEPDEILHDFL